MSIWSDLYKPVNLTASDQALLAQWMERKIDLADVAERAQHYAVVRLMVLRIDMMDDDGGEALASDNGPVPSYPSDGRQADPPPP